jgi:hypothetical protein
MTEHEASRTLVKSPPELWAECSDAASLARHLGEFGEIAITRLDPETAVAWEGERASGTVRIEPSGWGTRVTLTAQVEVPEAAEAVAEPEVEPVESEPVAEEPEPVAVEPEPEPVAVEPEPEPVVVEPEPEPVAEAEPEPAPAPAAELLARAGFFARVRRRFRPPASVVIESRPAPVAEPDPAPVASPQPEPGPEPEPEVVREPQVVPEPDPAPLAAAEPAPPEPEPSLDAPSVLTAALESLGQAHHRPFSRS